MNFESQLKKGILFSFIPKKLTISDRPELEFFPFNVMFARYKQEGSKLIMGTAIYAPDLFSFKTDKNIRSMEYRNIYGGENWLEIVYNENDKIYYGKKFINGKPSGMATGSDWNMFFVHFTALGLNKGETCELRFM